MTTDVMSGPDEKPQERTPKRQPRQARELARRLGVLTEAQAAAGWGVVNRDAGEPCPAPYVRRAAPEGRPSKLLPRSRDGEWCAAR